MKREALDAFHLGSKQPTIQEISNVTIGKVENLLLTSAHSFVRVEGRGRCGTYKTRWPKLPNIKYLKHGWLKIGKIRKCRT